MSRDSDCIYLVKIHLCIFSRYFRKDYHTAIEFKIFSQGLSYTVIDVINLILKSIARV